MRASTLKADILLLIAAAIWGFAFVAQRVGMDHVGPFTFNVARFVLGSLSLLPVILLAPRLFGAPEEASDNPRQLWIGGLIAGLILFGGSSFQQAGLVYTTAGKAGFITGLYIVIVPMMALFWRQKTGAHTWLGAALAVIGLYFLSMNDDWSIAFGDFLQLCGAFCWAAHVVWIGRVSRFVDPLKLSMIQFLFCAFLSLLVALRFEIIEAAALMDAAVPIFYAGTLSVAVAYTLQVVAQREAPAAHAAIIMSLEAVFAAIGGWLFLNEMLSPRGLLGCGLMMLGMLVSQFPLRGTKPPHPPLEFPSRN